jgi:hypothetical protein
MIVMRCEACGWNTQGHKKGRLKKRLHSHLSDKPCEEVQHQPTFPTEFHKPKEKHERDDGVCSFDTDGVLLLAQSHMTLQAAKEQSETSRDDKKLPGHIVEMDAGSSSFDSGEKYWPAQSHIYAAMVGVENTIPKVGEVEDQNMPEEKVITVTVVGLGRDTFDHPGKTTVPGATKQHEGECDPHW